MIVVERERGVEGFGYIYSLKCRTKAGRYNYGCMYLMTKQGMNNNYASIK